MLAEALPIFRGPILTRQPANVTSHCPPSGDEAATKRLRCARARPILGRWEVLCATSETGAVACELAVGQNQWYHFGSGAPPMLEPIIVGDWAYGTLQGLPPESQVDIAILGPPLDSLPRRQTADGWRGEPNSVTKRLPLTVVMLAKHRPTEEKKQKNKNTMAICIPPRCPLHGEQEVTPHAGCPAVPIGRGPPDAVEG